MKRSLNKCLKIIVLEVLIIMLIFFGNTIISFSADNVDENQVIEDGIYIIKSAINQKYVLDVLRSFERKWSKCTTIRIFSRQPKKV